MSSFKEKERVGEIKGVPIYIDWAYLRENYGLRRESEILDKAIGQFLISISVVGFIILIAFSIVQAENLLILIQKINNLYSILFWGFYAIFIYAFYLLRNPERFFDSLKMQNLERLRKSLKRGDKIEGIELSSYFSNSMLNVLDDLLKTDGHYFLEKLLAELLKFDSINTAIPRLGIKVDLFQTYGKTLGMELNSHVDEWLTPLVLNSFMIALENNFEKIDEVAIFIYLCKIPFRNMLMKNEVSEKEIEALQMWVKNVRDMARFEKMYKIKSALKPVSTVNRAFTSRYSPTLIKFSRDYTAEVAKGDFTYSIGREEELSKLIENLQSGDKSAIIILGSPGVGKTTFLKSLAVRMVVEDVPEVLKDMRLVGFDFTRAFAMSNTIEIFKKRLQSVMEEVVAAKNIVLVIDDLYQLVNIRPEYSSEIVGILSQTIDKYAIRLVCTSTPEGHSKYIKPQDSLVSLFDTVDMNEPSDEITTQIILDELPKIETKYKVKVEFDTIRKTIRLSHKFDFERVLPDKALDLLEEACVRAVNEKQTVVTEKHIDELVSEKVGVNVGVVDSDEAKSLINLESKLHSRVIGQQDAVVAVASAIRRSRTGLTSSKRPIASLLFFGPTGVGKTELAKALAASYYGDEKDMIRIDMSEYQEEENLARLIGQNEGDDFKGGYLTEAVREHPFSLVLLDEIEKANPKVLDLFLQILDEGSVTDGMGRKIEFQNTIIIATSNVASKEIADLISKGKNYREVLEDVMPKLRKYLRVEFINRFDKVIMFKPLSKIDILQVTALMLNKVKNKLSESDIQLNFGPELVEQVARLGYNPIYGARELNRVIQDNVEDKIATTILEKNLKAGAIILINNLENIEVK
jgi:ATP-dependent Clp protease ATP-binding subunit ClpC